MRVLSVSQLKGGSGRSTLTALIAAGYARRGCRVLVADCDEPQYSSSSWVAALTLNPKGAAAAANLKAVRTPTPEALRAAIRAAEAEGFPIVVIDSTPNLRPRTVAREALLCADLVLAPLSGTPADLWASQDFEKILKAAQTARPQLKARFVWNRVQRRRLQDEVRKVAADCLQTPALESVLGYRSAYAAMLAGDTLETMPGTKTAREEVKKLLDEVAAVALIPIA